MRLPFRQLVFAILLLSIVIFLLLAKRERPSSNEASPTLGESTEITRSIPPALEPTPEPPSQPTLGDEILQDYGKEGGSVKSDTTLFQRYLANVFILTKQRDPRHYATNEDLALFLRGQKGNLTPFLSQGSNILNEKSQLVDRFGHPLIIHVISRDQVQVRSIGNDHIPYTQDDIVLPPDSEDYSTPR